MTMTMLMLESKMDGACDTYWTVHHDVPTVWIFADLLEVSSAKRLNAVVPIIMISLIVYKCNLRGRPVGRPSCVYYFWILGVPTFIFLLDRHQVSYCEGLGRAVLRLSISDKYYFVV